MGLCSNLAIPVVSYAISVGHRVVSVPSVKYPARNQELLRMGVEFVEDLDKLEAIQRNAGHDNVRNMAFSMNTKPEDLLRFAPWDSLFTRPLPRWRPICSTRTSLVVMRSRLTFATSSQPLGFNMPISPTSCSAL